MAIRKISISKYPKPCVCAYVDVLGYSNILKEARTKSSRNLIFKTFQRAIKTALRKGQRASLGEYKYKIFSDNIIFAFPIYFYKKIERAAFLNNIRTRLILNILGNYQLLMAENGFFTRGGLTTGYLSINKLMVFGPALIKAVEIEEQIAIYPRISLNSSVLKLLNKSKQLRKTPVPFISKDETDDYFIDYLETCYHKSSISRNLKINFVDRLINHKNRICVNLTKYESYLPIYKKYLWLKKYHNNFCYKHFSHLTKATLKKISI